MVSQARDQPLWFVGFLLMARYEKDHLELDTRRRLYQLLQEYPGIHLSEIARRADIGTNHAKYHLEYLEKHGLASSRKEEGYWRFFPKVESELGGKDVLDRRDKDLLSLLRREVPLHVTLLMLEKGEATHSDLVDDVDVSGSTLHYHLKKMEAADLLESRKEGRKRIYQVREPNRVTRLLLQHKPPDELVSGFLDAWESLEI